MKKIIKYENERKKKPKKNISKQIGFQLLKLNVINFILWTPKNVILITCFSLKIELLEAQKHDK